MKHIVPVILLFAPYLLLAGMLSPEFAAWFNTLVNGLWLEVAIAAAIGLWSLSLYVVQKAYFSEKACNLWNLILKVGHLPFSTCMVLYILGNPRYMFLLFWPLFMTVTATGLYGVRAISLARKRDAVGKYFVLIHMIAGYLPVLDSLSAVFVFARLRKKKAETDKL